MAQTLIRGSTQILDGTITLAKLVSGYSIPTANLANGVDFIQRGGSVAFTSAQSMGNNILSNVADAVASQDAVNLRTAQALVNGIQFRSARVVSITNQTLTGLPTIDGITLTAGQIALLTAQTTVSQNGPWAVAAGAWTRPTNWATASTQKSTMFLVEEGTTYHDTKWIAITDAITVDSTSVTISQDQSGTSYVAGTGLTLTGNSFAVNFGQGIENDGSGNLRVKLDSTTLARSANGIKLADGTAPAQILLTNGSNIPTYLVPTGNVTINSSGVTAIDHTTGTGFTKYSDFVTMETPTGAINGSNTAFTLAATPVLSSLELFLNGQLLEGGSGNDYTISAAAITMLFTPASGDKLRACYIK